MWVKQNGLVFSIISKIFAECTVYDIKEIKTGMKLRYTEFDCSYCVINHCSYWLVFTRFGISVLTYHFQLEESTAVRNRICYNKANYMYCNLSNTFMGAPQRGGG